MADKTSSAYVDPTGEYNRDQNYITTRLTRVTADRIGAVRVRHHHRWSDRGMPPRTFSGQA